jgi:predicted translin family RNA/ssDNA-binding protein
MNEKETENMMDEPIAVKVSRKLIEDVKKKLGLHPATPAYIIVDTALREYAEAKKQ